jgi:hypothetical protein
MLAAASRRTRDKLVMIYHRSVPTYCRGSCRGRCCCCRPCIAIVGTRNKFGVLVVAVIIMLIVIVIPVAFNHTFDARKELLQ